MVAPECKVISARARKDPRPGVVHERLHASCSCSHPVRLTLGAEPSIMAETGARALCRQKLFGRGARARATSSGEREGLCLSQPSGRYSGKKCRNTKGDSVLPEG